MSDLNKTTYLPEEMAEEIRGLKKYIGSGGGSEYDTSEHSVVFYDYEGTVLYLYSPENFLSLTEMPPNPSHEGLIAQGWNWDFGEAKDHVRKFGVLDVGQMYTTSDGKTRIYIRIGDDWPEFYLNLGVYKADPEYETEECYAVVNWGDDSSDILSVGSLSLRRHTYSETGQYIVKINFINSNGRLSFSYNQSDLTTYSPKDIYKIEVGENIAFGTNIFVPYAWWSYLFNLESITLPETVSDFGGGQFDSCYKLRHVTVPKGFTALAAASFENCYSLKSVSLPNSIVGFYAAAFGGCSKLSRVILSENTYRIADGVFSGCNSLSGSFCFDNLLNDLNSTYWTINGIPSAGFTDCTSITELEFPDGLIRVGKAAFSGCKSLRRIRLPRTIEYINASAFLNCVCLDHISLPEPLVRISSNAFEGCYTLSSITIPSGVTVLSQGVFKSCSSLETVSILGNITKIDTEAFHRCFSLRTVNLPDSITEIGESAFYSCRNLRLEALPDSLTSIGDHAFYYCSSISSISIPDTIETIGMASFEGVPLKSIYFCGMMPPEIGYTAFSALDSNCIIYVPRGRLNAYLNKARRSSNHYPKPDSYTYVEFGELPDLWVNVDGTVLELVGTDVGVDNNTELTLINQSVSLDNDELVLN